MAERLNAVYLRIDVIEQALRNCNGHEVIGEGYSVAYALAESNLLTGNTVVADSVNAIPMTRNAWRDVGLRASARTVEIEVICSDNAEHRRRVESRKPDLAGHKLPTWEDVTGREYLPWDTKNITIDTAVKTTEESLGLLVERLSQ